MPDSVFICFSIIKTLLVLYCYLAPLRRLVSLSCLRFSGSWKRFCRFKWFVTAYRQRSSGFAATLLYPDREGWFSIRRRRYGPGIPLAAAPGPCSMCKRVHGPSFRALTQSTLRQDLHVVGTASAGLSRIPPRISQAQSSSQRSMSMILSRVSSDKDLKIRARSQLDSIKETTFRLLTYLSLSI